MGNRRWRLEPSTAAGLSGQGGVAASVTKRGPRSLGVAVTGRELDPVIPASGQVRPLQHGDENSIDAEAPDRSAAPAAEGHLVV